jgi:uncharacterized protein YndB with AHSA1/START domain
MRLQQMVLIDRSPEDVWMFVVDHRNDPRWCTKVKLVEPAGDGKWTVLHKPVPLRPAVKLELERLKADPPRSLALREEDDAAVFFVTYRLDPEGPGTRFTQISEFEWKKLPRFLRGMFARGVRRDVRRQLRHLKRVLESR